MFSHQRRSKLRRRGIVLVLILGMLSLLALIGVTFATFAGQSLINTRNYAFGQQRPSAEELMDYALSQLINDTNNPLSALRGHSLLRDMYGNDSVFRGAPAERDTNNPNRQGSGLAQFCYNAKTNGYLDSIFDSNGQVSQLFLTAAQTHYDATSPYAPRYLQFTTNIPTGNTDYRYAGLNFNRWILRMQQPANAANSTAAGVNQTFEIIEDDDTGPYHRFTLQNNLGVVLTEPLNTAFPPGVGNGTALTNRDFVTMTFANGNNEDYPFSAAGRNSNKSIVPLASSFLGTNPFVLDGRYMRAFNGPGMSRRLTSDEYNPFDNATYSNYSVPFNVAAYANFRINGNLISRALPADATNIPPLNPATNTPPLGDPDLIGMDEDYDACDLENWFLAIQSADGEVMIPSFHRPGILTPTDWGTVPNTLTTGSLYAAPFNIQKVMAAAKILRPRQVDNSPLFPSDPLPGTDGKIRYDVDNDGDGVSDSVWLDLGYPVQRDPAGKLYKPLFAFMVLGQNGRLPLNTAGNLQARDYQTIDDMRQNSPTTPPPGDPASWTFPNSYYDAPLWDHASHLGTSPNEINPKFALQNAPSPVFGNGYGQLDNTTFGGATLYPATPVGSPLYHLRSAGSNALDNPGGMPVDLTQLRNLLAGTVPADNATAPNFNLNGEGNFVLVNNQKYYLPNNVADPMDQGYNGNAPASSAVNRSGVNGVEGRWGELPGIPATLGIDPTYFLGVASHSGAPLYYGNPVRAGRSYNTGGAIDSLDDDFDSMDFQPEGAKVAPNGVGLTVRMNPEDSDNFDAAGQIVTPSERIRRFVSPIDPVGVGRMTSWSNRPNHIFDFGNGSDGFGRVGFFRYFRPAGIPQEIKYFTNAELSAAPAWVGPARYQMPKLSGASIPDITNNQYHGYESQRNPIASGGTPDLQLANVAVFGAMPFNYAYNQTQETPAKLAKPALDLPTNALLNASRSAQNAAGIVNQSLTFDLYANSQSGPSFWIRNGANGQNTNANLSGTTAYYPAANPQNPNAALQVLPLDGNATDMTVLPNSFAVRNGYPFGGLNKDEADEMNLYTPSLSDRPFGPTDLEWLVRLQDVDGSSLDSRLAKLAPVSFLNPADGLTRRRMFTTDTWDLINFAYANDNPGNRFPWNSRFGQYANASLERMNQVTPIYGSAVGTTFPPTAPVTTAFANPLTTEFLPNPTLEAPITSYRPNPTASVTTLPAALSVNPQANWSGNTNPAAYPVATPAVAHRDRRINLNAPLPISNDPIEPVRQKWIRETYQFLKAILPPQSVDTPQELAALSQYVINIIDFRDPDCTITKFVNTDLMTVPATATTHQGVEFATIPVPQVNSHYPFDPTISTDTSSAWNTAMSGNNPFLVQYGMEYNPIAINEVFAYQTRYKNPANATSTPTTAADNKRLFIEVVNTLTDANGNNASDLNLRGWDVVVAPDDDARGRPDPVTGNLPSAFTLTTNVNHHVLNLTNSVPAIQTNGINAARGYYVLGTTAPTSTSTPPNVEVGPITADYNLPATFLPPDPPAGSVRYCWVYLRRPANPFDATSDKVVVDCMRFPYADGRAAGVGGTTTLNNMTGKFTDTRAVSNGTKLYSVERLQPYRGGHKVGNSGGVTGSDTLGAAYGYSEQSRPSSTTSNSFGLYYGPDTNNVDNTPLITNPSPPPPQILGATQSEPYRNSERYQHTIGSQNSTRDPYWSHFAFHDRDFQSVAELLLVPGCPPGLFTKQFIEEPYPGQASVARSDSTLNRTTPDTAPNIGRALVANEPNPFPYLVDKFYYTAASVDPNTPSSATETYPARIGEWTGAGWHKILEFFEVPSSMNGAIGLAASGDNFDWYREDRRPGQLNLNLIVDEEVFYGLIDDPRLNSFLNTYDYNSALPQVVSQVAPTGYPATPAVTNSVGFYPISNIRTNFPDIAPTAPIGPPATTAEPFVVPGAQPSGTGSPIVGAQAGRGFTAWDPRLIINPTGTSQVGYVHGIKAAFSDFLKMRHGGSGFLFAWGEGIPGSGVANTSVANSASVGTPVAAERPFHSLSYPDINYTVMRPATLPASIYTLPNTVDPVNPIPPTLSPFPYNRYTYQTNATDASPILWPAGTPTMIWPAGSTTRFFGDPGLMNPFVSDNSVTPKTPIIPARRLFQVPDYSSQLVVTTGHASNASLTGQSDAVGVPITNPQLSVTESTLVVGYRNHVLPPPNDSNFGTGNQNHIGTYGNMLGSGLGLSRPDRRQHPAYRIEWLQKVMNLTTVRTHQFAVWITVGFFEVVKAGSPTLGIPDTLGAELGGASGSTLRYRSFFLLDRTRATGYNPYNPGDFRQVVTYRRRIA